MTTVTGMPPAPTALALQDIELGANCRRDVGDVSELARSILQVGVLQPLLVEPLYALGDQHRGYGLVAGYRRYRAAEVAGLTQVPVVVVAPDLDRMTVNLVENLHRVDLSPIEKGHAVQRMVTAGHTQQQVAQATGWTPGWVNRLLAYVTKLCPEAQEAYHHGKLTQVRVEHMLTQPVDVQLRMLATGTNDRKGGGRKPMAEARLVEALAAFRRGEEDAALVAARQAVHELERRHRDGRTATPRHGDPPATDSRDRAERRAIARASTSTNGHAVDTANGHVPRPAVAPPPRSAPTPTTTAAKTAATQARPDAVTAAQTAVLPPAGQRARQVDNLDDNVPAGRPKVKCVDCKQWLAIAAGATAKKRLVAHVDLTGCSVTTQLRALR